MNFAASVTCLSRPPSIESLRGLRRHSVDELHCDFFPDLDGAPSLTQSEISWCIEVWRGPIALHLWSLGSLDSLPLDLIERSEVLVQIEDEGLLETLISTPVGSIAGVSFCPALNQKILDVDSIPYKRLQVLSTTTPGYPGGNFQPETKTAVEALVRHRRETNGAWTIELDGGLGVPELTWAAS